MNKKQHILKHKQLFFNRTICDKEDLMGFFPQIEAFLTYTANDVEICRTLLFQQDVQCCLFLDKNDKSVTFYYCKVKSQNYFHVNSFCCINFVVVDNITLMRQHATLFFITK